MEHGVDNGSLALGLAMFVGVLAQGLARHLRVPGIVLLLTAGVILGPDVVNLIHPETLGTALSAFVGFAVAIILFEGGLSLNIKKLRQQAKPIRRLVSIGAVCTGIGATLTVHWCMGWDWRLSVLFGTLVIVTGPTVITPLLRRVKVRQDLEVILEAEGIFIDAVGATIAVVALEAVLAPPGDTVFASIYGIAVRMGVGTVVGLGGGMFLAILLRWRKVVPDGLANILGLATAVALFQISNQFAEESGIVAVIVAGVLVGNARSHALGELKEFGGQLTELLIATLFVLLAADVRLADIESLGINAIISVAILIFVVRPITVLASTTGTTLSFRDKVFLSWLAPRGIVAAAVASLFATRLTQAGMDGGTAMRALVFLVIATTVAAQGLTGGMVASLLGVRRPKNDGFLILGANALAIRLGEALRSTGAKVVFIDSNPQHREAAEAVGTFIIGNGLEEHTLHKAHAETRLAALGLTSREDANYLFAQNIRESFSGPTIYVALETSAQGVTVEMVRKSDCNILFGAEYTLKLWDHRLRYQHASVERWHFRSTEQSSMDLLAPPQELALPLLVSRKGRPVLIDQSYEPRTGDIAWIVVAKESNHIQSWLETGGWEPVP